MNGPKKIITLKMDGQEISASEEQTVLECARAQGIFIPSLCQFQGLSNVGACRLCLVEIKGIPRLVSACVTRIAEGMDIQTATPKLNRYRKMILELLFAERNHLCAICVSNGNCELQSMAAMLGVEHVRYPYRYPRLSVDASHRRFIHDPNRCILCTRCARVCEEVEGARTWNVRGRGIRSLMITDMAQSWGESISCTSCGKCINACPTGALVEKGQAAGDRIRRENLLPYLAGMRTSGR